MNKALELVMFDVVAGSEVDVLDLSKVNLLYAVFGKTLSFLSDCRPDDVKSSGHAVSGARESSRDSAPPALVPSVVPVNSYQNSFQAVDQKLYILCQCELRTAYVQSWLQQADVLVAKGEWLEALALALDHYEARVRPTETDRALVATRAGLPTPPRSTETLKIADLLVRYLRLAVTNAPPPGDSISLVGGERIDLRRSHFQMLAGVCIEFCVVTDLPALLSQEVYGQFIEAEQGGLFCELLEPYILSERLRRLGPQAMQGLVEYFRATNRLARVEVCLLHMDVKVAPLINHAPSHSP